jgi:cytochrome P450
LNPVTLSDGTTLPTNTSLAVAADAVARDPRIWGNASEFDGYRFEKLRKTPADDNRYQFTSINEESLSFGEFIFSSQLLIYSPTPVMLMCVL